MTFPAVVNNATTTALLASGAGPFTAAINLPSSIVSGNKLIVFITTTNFITGATLSGFTNILNKSGYFYSIWERVADGSEGATATLSYTGTARTHSAVAVQVSGADALTAIEVAEANTGASSTGTPDPPSLTPSWGAADTLWFAAVAAGSGKAYTSSPASYTAVAQVTTTVTIDVAYRQLNAASEDPGTFSTQATTGWEQMTVGVKPGAAASGNMLEVF